MLWPVRFSPGIKEQKAKNIQNPNKKNKGKMEFPDTPGGSSTVGNDTQMHTCQSLGQARVSGVCTCYIFYKWGWQASPRASVI